MADIYEFHVTGLIGPVVQSAFPELTSVAGETRTTISGAAAGPTDIDALLRRLDANGLVTHHILLTDRARWLDAPPVTDA